MTEVDLPSVNYDLADKLALIASYYTQDGDYYRAKAYSAAAQRICEYPTPITSGAEAQKEIPRVGTSLAYDIDEYLTTGQITRLQQLEQSHADRSQIIKLFMSIHGIGSVTANKFYDRGYRTLEDLWFKARLTSAQRLGIEYSEHLKLKIPREEMDLINNQLNAIFQPLNLEWLITGSYRRGEPESGDIDVLIKQKPGITLADIVDQLKKAGLLVGDLALGASKYLGIIQLPEFNAHRIDLLLIPEHNWAYAILYFTGSQRFNILIRQRAKDLGLRLNEYGLFDEQGNLYPADTEQQIFEYLGVKYLSPIERTRNLMSLPLYSSRK